MDIKIQRPSPACGICGARFADGEQLTTALRDTGEQDVFQRHDVCNRCWPKQEHATFRCYWSLTHSEKRRSPLLDADVLWQVFHNSFPCAGANKDAGEFAYVAALGLMRLKQLTLESTRRESGGEFLVFATKDKGSARARYDVRDPDLDEAAVERVQDRLADAAGGAPESADTRGDEEANKAT